MPVVCRPARAQDLEFADTLVVSSINDLTERHGFGPMAVSSPPRFQLFSLQDDARGLWVAEEDGRFLGFAWSWVCGDMWFLAQLFVSPDHQGPMAAPPRGHDSVRPQLCAVFSPFFTGA